MRECRKCVCVKVVCVDAASVGSQVNKTQSSRVPLLAHAMLVHEASVLMLLLLLPICRGLVVRGWCYWASRGQAVAVLGQVVVVVVTHYRVTVRGDGGSQVSIKPHRGAVAFLRCAVDVAGVLVDGLGVRCGRVRSSTGEVRLLSHELGKLLRHSRVVGGRVLAGEGGRGLVKVVRQCQQRHVLRVIPLSIVHFGTGEDGSREGERRSSHHRRLGGDKVAVVHGNLAEVGRHVLNLLVISLLRHHELSKEVDGGVADGPVESVENVHLHLGEHSGVVESAAHVVKFVNLRDSILLVTILGSDEEGGTSDKLVMLLVHHSLGAVPVEKVDGEEQRLGEEGEGGVGLDEEVDEVGPHEPLDLALHVNEGSIGKSLFL